MMQMGNRIMAWLNEHFNQFRSRPKNGRKSMKEIDAMLREINGHRERVIHSTETIVKDSRRAKQLVAEGNDVLKYHNS